MSTPSQSSVSRVASVLSRPGGMTLKEISQALGVSRQTAIRWLTLMEKGGLVHRVHRTDGKRGRPQGVYHPTTSLSKFLEENRERPTVLVKFSAIISVCRHHSKGVCNSVDNNQKRCDLVLCPLLKI
jgi:predicted ArsR family transcriptional regulator